MNPRHIPAGVRLRVAESSRFRCGYCLTSQRIVGPLLEIDHIIPEARGGTADEENLTLACPMCNSHKADRVEAWDAMSMAMTPLFNPRRDTWHEHFEWTDEGARIRGRTATGRATVSALAMNHPDIVSARRLWAIAGWHPSTD
jgi:hypothetical protein